MIKAPWDKVQVANLQRCQACSSMHSYTCADSLHGDLIPTEKGWVCQSSNYTQDWAHASDVKGKFVDLFPANHSRR